MNKKRGFSITELLVSIAIIGILTTLVVPGVDRALNKNRLPNDIKVMEAKLADIKMMAGSRQTEQGGVDYGDVTKKMKLVGFYGIYFPNTALQEYYIVRLSINSSGTSVDPGIAGYDYSTNNYCWVDEIQVNIANYPKCIVETIKLSKDVKFKFKPANIYVYTIPDKSYKEIKLNGTLESVPTNPIMVRMEQADRTATVNINVSSATINTTFN